MTVKSDARISEFETPEREVRYGSWLREKVAARLADTRPAIAHDEVMADVDRVLETATDASRR